MQDQNLVAHLSATEMLGLSPSSQFQLAAFRVAYSPRMWANAAEKGMRWPGTFFVGGKVVKGAFDSIGEGFGPGLRKKTMEGIGAFFGGGAADFLKVRNVDYYQKMFSSGKMFTREGMSNILKMEASISMRQNLKAAGYSYYNAGAMPYTTYNEATGRYTTRTVTSRGRQWMYRQGADRAGASVVTTSARARAAAKAGGLNLYGNLGKFLGTRAMAAVSTALTAKLIFDVTSAIGYGAVAGVNAIAARISSNNLLDFGSGSADFAQSSGAYTERQRAVRAIQSSNLNGRRFLGNEAAMVHV